MWGSRVSGRVVVRFGMCEFRVYSHLLKEENYMLVNTVIFSAVEITCCHSIIYEMYLVGHIQILEQ